MGGGDGGGSGEGCFIDGELLRAARRAAAGVEEAVGKLFSFGSFLEEKGRSLAMGRNKSKLMAPGGFPRWLFPGTVAVPSRAEAQQLPSASLLLLGAAEKPCKYVKKG